MTKTLLSTYCIVGFIFEAEIFVQLLINKILKSYFCTVEVSTDASYLLTFEF